MKILSDFMDYVLAMLGIAFLLLIAYIFANGIIHILQ